MKFKLPASIWFWGTCACLLGLMGLRFEILQRRLGAALPEPTAALVPVGADPASFYASGPPPAPAAQPSARARQPIADTLRHSESIYLSLKKHQVAELQIAHLNQALKRVFDPSTESRVRDHYVLALDTSGRVQHFEYTPHLEPERPVLVERQGGQLFARRLALPLDRRTSAISAFIEDNLSNAIQTAGETDALTDLLADNIFASVIDFRKDSRRGDRIGIVFEKLYMDERFVRYGRVLLADYAGDKVSQTAIFYESPRGNRGYYDREGHSLERMFAINPLAFRRISSNFNRKRFHPILKKTVPHLGTDYAAARGTEVWATARGRVVHAGWKGGYGKLVEIEHPNGYRTRYAHLSRIRVRKGQRVVRQQVVGYVGSTGRATGPHLHYEVIKDGHHLNPEKVKRANQRRKGKALAAQYRRDFAAQRDRLLAVLARGPILASGPGE